MVLKTLKSPLDSKEIKPINPKGNKPWIFTGRTDAETLILWPPDAKCWTIGKTLMLGKVEGRKGRGWQKMSLLDGIIDSMDMSLNKLWEMVKDREALHAAVHEVTKSWKWLNNWTTTKNERNKQGLQRGSLWNLIKLERIKGNWYSFPSIPDYL